MAAVSASCRRYVSAVYEDKYFPDKNAAIPFKWEALPGMPKSVHPPDDQQNARHGHNALQTAIKEAAPPAQGQQLQPAMKARSTVKDDDPMHTSLATSPVSIYPLRPPPKLTVASRPLRVKDVLRHGCRKYSVRGPDDDDEDGHCPLHSAYRHSFPWLSLRFWPLKAQSAVVPLHKSSYCVLGKPTPPSITHGGDAAMADRCSFATAGSPGLKPLEGRSQSLRFPAHHGSSCRPAFSAGGPAAARLRAPERRCNSFNSLFAPRHTIFEDDEGAGGEAEGTESTMATAAAAAMWAGAYILAAAAAAEGQHHHNGTCRVTSKLRDLMQQSGNFSELGLTACSCRGAIAAPCTKRRTKSVAEEVAEAFLKEGTHKSCTSEGVETHHETHHELQREQRSTPAVAAAGHDDDDDNDDCLQQNVVKRKSGFLSVLKSGCIACWCPSSTH